MKAVFFTRHGGNEVLQYGDRPTPEPGPGEVRVAIRAAALNHLDIFVRAGIPDVPPGHRVLIQPGLFCGRCEFCRAGEQSLCVTFRLLGEHAPGTLAEYV